MKELPLTQGKIALVDNDIYEKAIAYKWHTKPHKKQFYARRSTWIVGKGGGHQWLHHFVLLESGIDIGDKQVDHINNNPLDNTLNNLRLVTWIQNNRNIQKKENRAYKGVYYSKQINRWRSEFQIDKKRFQIGTFKTELDAAKAYDIVTTAIDSEHWLNNNLNPEEDLLTILLRNFNIEYKARKRAAELNGIIEKYKT